MTQTKNTEDDFHAVEFMRQVRRDLSEKYLRDQEQYLLDLKRAMEEFKRKQENVHGQQPSWQNPG
jgi:hypothetical protein